jgi:hypothetical protein
MGLPAPVEAADAGIGSGNPYLSAERTVFWLAAIGRGKIEGISPMNPDLGNPGGAKYWEELVAVADGPGDDTVRVRAIRALGLVGYPVLRPALERWLADPEQGVRKVAAMSLLAFTSWELLFKHLQARPRDEGLARNLLLR